MTGSKLAELMIDTTMKRMVAKAARRRSKCVETQEEYIQDVWLRFAKCPDDSSVEFLEHEARRAVKASQMRMLRTKWGGHKKPPENVAGISVTENGKKKLPRGAIHLYQNKYLDPDPESLDWQYYEGQEEEMAGADRWYNTPPDFDSLPEKEKAKIANKFRNSGYSVGPPISGTRGKKMKFYKIVVST